MRESGIYALVNRENGKRYVGRSVDLEKRRKTHLWALKNGRHANNHLQRAWNQGQRFDFVILEKCPVDQCNEREIYWIAYYDAMNVAKGYNQCEGGKTTTGYHFTEKQKKKISDANIGRKFSEDVIARRTASLKRHIAEDPEFAERLHQFHVDQMKSRKPYNKGKHLTLEQRQKISAGVKGRIITKEHREKLRKLYSGEGSLSAKMKQSDIVKIRYRFLCGERQIDIRKDYPQITTQTIYDIVRGRRWKSVPMDKDELEKMLESEERDGTETVAKCCDNI